MNMTADQLKPTFEPFGNIEEVTIIYDKTTQMSKGARHRARGARGTPRAARGRVTGPRLPQRDATARLARGYRDRAQRTRVAVARRNRRPVRRAWWFAWRQDVAS